MAQQQHNKLVYIIVCAIMLLPLQNGMAAMGAVVDVPSVSKQVCQQIKDHANHHADTSIQMDMQKHDNNCCGQDKTCQQQCSDCVHCLVVSATLNNFPSLPVQGLQHLYSAVSIFPETASISLQFRPPRI